MSLQIYYAVPFNGTEREINELKGIKGFNFKRIENTPVIEVENKEEKDLLEKGNIILFTDIGPKVVLNEYSFTSCR